jgi:uridine kinase
MATRVSLIEMIAKVILNLEKQHPTRVAIDGIDAAGKTRFADELGQVLKGLGKHVIRASIDGFHNSRIIRYARGRYNPEGYYLDSFNYRVLLDELIDPLGPEGDLTYRKAFFDYEKNEKLDQTEETASEDSVLVFDGVFLLRPEIINHWDLKIYLDIDYSESMRREISRDRGDREELRTLYEKRYIPGQKLYHIHANPKRHTDLIIENSNPYEPRITYTSSKIKIIIGEF